MVVVLRSTLGANIRTKLLLPACPATKTEEPKSTRGLCQLKVNQKMLMALGRVSQATHKHAAGVVARPISEHAMNGRDRQLPVGNCEKACVGKLEHSIEACSVLFLLAQVLGSDFVRPNVMEH
eukprot:5930321-Amphidinium_carterae.3